MGRFFRCNLATRTPIQIVAFSTSCNANQIGVRIGPSAQPLPEGLALDVTPPGKAGFLAYRVTVTAGVAAGVTLFAAPLVIPDSGAGLVLLVALFIAAEAVIAALLLPVIARNKVEGLALTKLINIASLAPLVAFAPSPWRYIAGILPPYWVGELVWPLPASSIGLPVAAALGTVVHLATIALLFRLLRKRAG